MPPPMNRFPPGQNPSGYHQQFPGHGQHPTQPHQSQLPGYPSNIHPNSQPNAFSNPNLPSLLSNLGAGFNLGGDSGLASHAARMSFQQAGNHQLSQQQAVQQMQQQVGQQHHQSQQHPQHQPQQHQQHPQHVAAAHHAQQVQHSQQSQVQNVIAEHPTRGQTKGRIREVWAHNLEEEMAILGDLIDNFPYVSMDTEFPGVVARPMGGFHGKSDYHYQCLRTNVDMLKLIQVGVTLFNENGELPANKSTSANSTNNSHGGGRRGGKNSSPLPHAWQFNLKFSLKEDMYNATSIESLQEAGIDFTALERDGIDPFKFAALLIPSGLVCFKDVRWISFHGGYDFGYLTKLLHCTQLPSDEFDFDRLMKLYFPSIYDVKHLLKYAVKLHNTGALQTNDPSVAEILTKFEQKSGLEHIAEALKLKRVGVAHQAGSDSLITGRVFFELRKRIFNDKIADEHLGKVWGLGIPDYSVAGSGAGITASAGNNANTSSGTGGATGTGTENAPPVQNGAGNSVHQQQQNGGTPSTPNTNPAGLVSTPAAGAHNTNGGGGGGNASNLGGMGPMTPGGGGGVFGAFAFGGGNR
ncbi:putative ccr4-not transcription complex subunit 7 protein [Rhypophila sp. PSN 637]